MVFAASVGSSLVWQGHEMTTSQGHAMTTSESEVTESVYEELRPGFPPNPRRSRRRWAWGWGLVRIKYRQ